MNLWGREFRTCTGCEKQMRTLFENIALAGTVEEFLALTDAPLARHVAACPACRESLESALEGRALLRAAYAPEPGPEASFAAGVIAEIRARERKQGAASDLWPFMQALASRLAWVAAVLLLAASTVLYKVQKTPAPAAAGVESTGDRFPEPPQQPASRDEVLVSLGERNP